MECHADDEGGCVSENVYILDVSKRCNACDINPLPIEMRTEHKSLVIRFHFKQSPWRLNKSLGLQKDQKREKCTQLQQKNNNNNV